MTFSNGLGAILSGISALCLGGQTFLSEKLKKFSNAQAYSRKYLLQRICFEKTRRCLHRSNIYFIHSSFKAACDCLSKLFLIARFIRGSFSKMKLVKTFLRNSMTRNIKYKRSTFNWNGTSRRGHRAGVQGMHPPTRPKRMLKWHLISLNIVAKIFLYCTLLSR